MDGQGKESVSLLGAAALFLTSAVRNPLCGLHRPSGAAWSWLPNLRVAVICFIRKSLCRTPEKGQDFHSRPS